MQTIFYTLLYAALNVSGAALIKWQLKGVKLASIGEWVKFLWNIPFVAAFVLILFSALALFKALSTNSFSLIIPFATGVNFVLTILVGAWFFKDRLSATSFLGFVLILCGILILSLNKQAHA